MKKRYLIGMIGGLIATVAGLASCSNLIEDLKGKLKMPTDFVKINGGTYDGTTELTPSSYVFKTGRTVMLSDFYICNHEVTQAEYEKYCNGGAGYTYGKGPNHPAYVSWYDALVYCNKRSIAEGLTPCYTIGGKTNPDEWGAVPTSSNSTWNDADCNFSVNGYRLPTEAEWEYCARSENSDNYTYSGSNTIEDVAWYDENSGNKAHEVKRKSPNSKGLYDMSGNVWEWCWDWYGTIENDTPSVGIATGSCHVFRGGSMLAEAFGCTVSFRVGDRPPYYRLVNNGIRVVRSAQ